MAATPPGTLIDVIVLVFARSELKNLVGTDALRTVLSGSQRALFPEPGTMSLQPVWELIESQPGFDAELAIPPMCRLKAWEAPLKVKVELPESLVHLDLATREKKAMECNAGQCHCRQAVGHRAAPHRACEGQFVDAHRQATPRRQPKTLRQKSMRPSSPLHLRCRRRPVHAAYWVSSCF